MSQHIGCHLRSTCGIVDSTLILVSNSYVREKEILKICDSISSGAVVRKIGKYAYLTIFVSTSRKEGRKKRGDKRKEKEKEKKKQPALVPGGLVRRMLAWYAQSPWSPYVRHVNQCSATCL